MKKSKYTYHTNRHDSQPMPDIHPKDVICSNCNRWTGTHRFDLKGMCKYRLVPMPFNNNCHSIGKSNKFKKRR